MGEIIWSQQSLGVFNVITEVRKISCCVTKILTSNPNHWAKSLESARPAVVQKEGDVGKIGRRGTKGVKGRTLCETLQKSVLPLCWKCPWRQRKDWRDIPEGRTMQTRQQERVRERKEGVNKNRKARWYKYDCQLIIYKDISAMVS